MTMMAIMAGCKFEFEFCAQFSSELRANYFAFIIPAGNFNSAVYDIYYIFLRFIPKGMIFTIKKNILTIFIILLRVSLLAFRRYL